MQNENDELNETTDSTKNESISSKSLISFESTTTFSERDENKKNFNIAITNARSLFPKMDSLTAYFCEHDLAMFIVTETWLVDGPELEKGREDLNDKFKIGALTRNRPKVSNRNPGGGIAIIYKKEKVKLEEYPFKKKKYEIMAAKGKIPNNSRPFFVFAVYFPPKMRVDLVRDAMNLVSEAILKIKTEFSSPYILIGGDMNGFDLSHMIGDHNDIKILPSPPTRN